MSKIVQSLLSRITGKMIKTPKNILNLSADESKRFLDSFDNVFVDCDGVLWSIISPIPGVGEGIKALYDADKKISIVSNNSIRSREEYSEKFAKLGVKFDYDTNFVHPAESIVTYLKKIKFDGLIFMIASEPFKKVFSDNNFKFITAPDSANISNIKEFMKVILTKEPVSAVIFDFDYNFNLLKFYSCQYYLQKNPDCLLIFGVTDPEVLVCDIKFTGMTGFMDLLAETSKKKPIVLGKPGADLGDIIIEKYQIKDKSRVLFIGDNMEFDVGFANRIGFQTLLVLSGVTTKEMLENNENPEYTPDYYAERIEDFAKMGIVAKNKH